MSKKDHSGHRQWGRYRMDREAREIFEAEKEEFLGRMSCPVPPGAEHYPITVVRNGVPIMVCAKCQQEI